MNYGVTEKWPLHNLREQIADWPAATRSEGNSLCLDVPALSRPLYLSQQGRAFTCHCCSLSRHYPLPNPLSSAKARGRVWSFSRQSTAVNVLPCNVSNKRMSTSTGPPGGFFRILYHEYECSILAWSSCVIWTDNL